ncbi:MAG: hypothetical protein R6U84_04635, partial [Candidatus Cloacimonadales bacterium]
FIQSLLDEEADLEQFIEADELEKSQRLGIQYNYEARKYLISYELDLAVKAMMLADKNSYQISEETIAASYSKITLQIAKLDYEKEYYFKNSKLISPLSYFSKDWLTAESKYFRFILADSALTNQKAIRELDNFVDDILQLLDFSEAKKVMLKEKKIFYILCQDQEQIKQLTGYNTRGIYYLASDTIVSTFNTHYHELVHLLINYRLGNLGKFTNPFLLEGLAVALGGRGGKKAEIIHDLGFFLSQNDFVSYKDLLSSENFYQSDASITYPVSGLYLRFLIDYLPIGKLLDLYQKYNYADFQISEISLDDLPNEAIWQNYIADYESFKKIKVSSFLGENLITSQQNLNIFEQGEYYEFETEAEILLLTKAKEGYPNYVSSIFSEILPRANYQSEAYLISIDSAEINIYDLFTNNLIACYLSSFSSSQSKVPQQKGWYRFSLQQAIFEQPLNKMKIIGKSLPDND